MASEVPRDPAALSMQAGRAFNNARPALFRLQTLQSHLFFVFLTKIILMCMICYITLKKKKTTKLLLLAQLQCCRTCIGGLHFPSTITVYIHCRSLQPGNHPAVWVGHVLYIRATIQVILLELNQGPVNLYSIICSLRCPLRHSVMPATTLKEKPRSD